MKNLLFTLSLFISALVFGAAPSKKQQDINAIHQLAGCYKVTFDFAETFAPDENYKYHDRYHEEAIEYVFVANENENLISLQHILIINDSIIIKHWRQDWIYENTELLAYDKDYIWKKVKLDAKQVKGQWTQKVYQVDDGPRYEANGTWVHADGRHFWESEGDSPLPRREFTKRNDYNVLRRFNHIEITADGWMLEQDNEKIIRNEKGDQLLCREKGLEKFTKGNYNCSIAEKWWAKHGQYWQDVRTVWNSMIAEQDKIQLHNKVNNKPLYEELFRLGETLYTAEQPKRQVEIRKAIEAYMIKS
ncbi:MAG: DUF6607 family protein [Bacteroidota bacterium]